MNDYWRDCVAESFEDAGISASSEQIDTVASWVEGAFENYSLATGAECIPNPQVVEAKEYLRKVRAEITKRQEWELSTKPCRSCTTTGWVLDGWGRDAQCQNCSGTGRHK